MAEGLADDFDVPDLIDGLEAIALKNTEIDEQWWTDFLNRELPSTAKYERNNAIQPGALKTGDGTLVKRVGEKLEKQQAETKKKNEADKAKADATLERSLRQLLEQVCSYGHKGTLEGFSKPVILEFHEQHLKLTPRISSHFQSVWNDYVKATKKTKSDLDSSGSTWTIKMLARYVKQEDVDFILNPKEEEMIILYSKYSKLLVKIKEKIDILKAAIDGFVTECETRMLLDAILLTICAHHENLLIRTEQCMKFSSLPRHQPIGVVEAKRPGCLIQSSVAQLIQQLLCLSAGGQYYLYFGLLFDGFKYVFAAVSQEKILFFQEKDFQLHIYDTQFFSLPDWGSQSYRSTSMAYRKILRLLESTSLVNYQVTEKNQLLNCCEERIYCYLVVFLLLTDKKI